MTELKPEVIRLAMNGDTQAFRVLVSQCQGFAYSVSFRVLGHAQDAEDVVQEAFIRLWKHLPRYRFDVKLSTWLYKIIMNLCLDHLKSRHRQQEKNRMEMKDIFRTYASSTDGIEKEELHTLIQEAASGLAPAQKAVFVLRDLEGLEAEEVCAILSMTAGNMKSNLYYARKQVAEFLKANYQLNENPKGYDVQGI
jgi:RNA polymerase sigma-70 factor, ECF subfamily